MRAATRLFLRSSYYRGRTLRLVCLLWFAITSLDASLCFSTSGSCRAAGSGPCRCSQVKRLSGTCCCSGSAPRQAAASSCCRKKAAPAPKPLASRCCSRGAPATAQPLAPSGEPSWSECRCDGGSGSTFLAEHKPQLNDAAVCVVRTPCVSTELRIQDPLFFSALSEPPEPPPREMGLAVS